MPPRVTQPRDADPIRGHARARPGEECVLDYLLRLKKKRRIISEEKKKPSHEGSCKCPPPSRFENRTVPDSQAVPVQ